MKTEMLLHFNKNNQSKAVDLVVNNLKEMDEEAWSIFFNHVRTSDDDLLPQKKEHKKIYRACKKLVFTDRNVNFKKTFYIRVFENEILKFW
jgi:tRNA U34 2-thiouridine synthase MnmA/TrmU